ncbi:MAG: asparaginase [Caldimonas sp.]
MKATELGIAGPGTVVLLGTGGTIAGRSASPTDPVGYRSAEASVMELLAALGPMAESIEAEQVAQVDSKDMDFSIWRRLAERVGRHLARDDVAGIVITHGTDTMEETAYFLQRVLAPAKPVVLTGAMRPASSLQSDGPQNLHDAVAVARTPGALGVVVVMAGSVHSGAEVRKVHPYRLDAFSAGDNGPVAVVENGRLRAMRDWPRGVALGCSILPADVAWWPMVEIVFSSAGNSGAIVDTLQRARVRGIVVAATGNGTVSVCLAIALLDAAAKGVAVLRATRCGNGRIVAGSSDAAAELPSADGLTPVQARIELMLRLMAADADADLRTSGPITI